MDSMPDPTKAPWHQRNIWPLVVGALFFVGLVFFFGWVAIVRYNEFVEHFDPATAPIHLRPDTLGPFGDFFGGITNPLLSFVGVCALFYSIYLQKDELRLTRVELEESKNALKAQEEELKRQNAQMRTQIKRDDFFRLIDFMTRVISEIVIPERMSSVQCTGHDATKQMNKYNENQKLNSMYPNEKNSKSRIDAIKSDTLYVIDEYNQQFELFIKSILIVVNFTINESDSTDQHFYFNLINSTLTNDEIILMSKYAITKNDSIMLRYITQSNFRINAWPFDEFQEKIMQQVVHEAREITNKSIGS